MHAWKQFGGMQQTINLKVRCYDFEALNNCIENGFSKITSPKKVLHYINTTEFYDGEDNKVLSVEFTITKEDYYGA